jgi:hypothetical protein
VLVVHCRALEDKTSLGRAVPIARRSVRTPLGISWRAAVGASHVVMARGATSACGWWLVQRSVRARASRPSGASSDPLTKNRMSEKPAFPKSTATCSSLS